MNGCLRYVVRLIFTSKNRKHIWWYEDEKSGAYPGFKI